MLKRKSKNNADVTSDDSAWDIKEKDDYDYSTPAYSFLQAEEVAAVRFHTGKPGYSFRQVEIFVEQVKQTLKNYEQALYEKDVLLHESNEEIEDLQEKCTTLQATIEVFRAKGDPLVNDDGSYVTASQVKVEESLREELTALQLALASLQAENLTLQSQIEETATLTEQNEFLRSALAAAEAERDEANAAEAEMREYVEVTLPLWIAQQNERTVTEETEASNTTVSDGTQDTAESYSDTQFDSETVAEGEEAELEELAQELSEIVPQTEDEDFLSSSVITIDSEETLSEEDLEVLSSLPDEGAEGWDDEVSSDNFYPLDDSEGNSEDRTSEDRLNILLSAPEVEGNLISPETLPMPTGGPIQGLPSPPVRNKSVLADAPELQG